MLDSTSSDECIYSSTEWARATAESDKIAQNFLMVFSGERLLGGVLYDIVDERFPAQYKVESFLNGYHPFYKNIPNTGVAVVPDSKSLSVTNRGAKSCDFRFDSKLTECQRLELFSKILSYLKEYSFKIGCRFFNFMYLPENPYYETISSLLSENGFNKMLVDASYSIPISFQDFDEYLHSFPGKRRRNIKSEIIKAEQATVSYERIPLDGNEAELAQFADINFSKYEYENFNVEAYAERMRCISRNFGAQAYIYTMKLEKESIGEILLLNHKDVLVARTIGVKSGFERVFPYFNLCYYTPIKLALKGGMKKSFTVTGWEKPS